MYVAETPVESPNSSKGIRIGVKSNLGIFAGVTGISCTEGDEYTKRYRTACIPATHRSLPRTPIRGGHKLRGSDTEGTAIVGEKPAGSAKNLSTNLTGAPQPRNQQISLDKTAKVKYLGVF